MSEFQETIVSVLKCNSGIQFWYILLTQAKELWDTKTKRKIWKNHIFRRRISKNELNFGWWDAAGIMARVAEKRMKKQHLHIFYCNERCSNCFVWENAKESRAFVGTMYLVDASHMNVTYKSLPLTTSKLNFATIARVPSFPNVSACCNSSRGNKAFEEVILDFKNHILTNCLQSQKLQVPSEIRLNQCDKSL